MNNRAPICFFVYNRLETTKQSINALMLNQFATETDLFIFSDGAKNIDDKKSILLIREYLKTITGFKSIQVIESDINKGLANSIIQGVSFVLTKYEKVIILEDDLVTTSNFLYYMNLVLDFYRNNPLVSTVCAFSHDFYSLKNYTNDIYFAYRPYSWGWGTWKDEWAKMNWDNKSYLKYIFNPIKCYKLYIVGSDIPQMLLNQILGKIDSWAIKWAVFQIINQKLSVFPKYSLIQNIGFNDKATHTKRTSRFSPNLFENVKFDFVLPLSFSVDKRIINDFRKNSSILRRLLDKF